MALRSVGRRNGFSLPVPTLVYLDDFRGKDCPNLIQHYAVILRVHVHVLGHGMATPPWRDVHV